MPLPPPSDREKLHSRLYDLSGYRRADGLWDIEGRLTDSKTYDFPNEYRGHIHAGEALHDMWLRLTIDEDFKVHDIEAAIDGSPYAICPNISPNFKRMIGATIGPGWRREIRQRVGGVQGCTHLVEMLGALATVAYQTLYPVRVAKKKEDPSATRPGLIDSCHAYRGDGEIVKSNWPDFYTGDT